MFSNGEYVMYGTSGLCRIAGTERRSFDGIHENEYFRLIPYGSENSSYYIPAETIGNKVRKLLTADEIYAVIDRIPSIKPIWDDDNTRRHETFNGMYKSGDYDKIICLIKSVYNQQQIRSAAGKKLPLAEEHMLKAAEKILDSEFAVVLGINPEDVADFISQRLVSVSEN
ncbi:MAG: hypothetical protein LUI05_08065 [Oscillospiraceae bacterium]|nr:hypothetical protein [Oscillospiraceae bacterium]